MLHLRIAAPELLLQKTFLLDRKHFTTHGLPEIRGGKLLINKCGHIVRET